jgi:hypothetical protein
MYEELSDNSKDTLQTMSDLGLAIMKKIKALGDSHGNYF